jgi:hypothetical protein
MGLEGAYFDAPALFLALEDLDYGLPPSSFMHLSKFIGQYHNERYMLDRTSPNVVTRCADLKAILAAVLREPSKAREYNASLAQRLPLKALPEIAAALLETEGRHGDS